MLASALQEDVPISDNHWLDQFLIPVGKWFEQTTKWIDSEMKWLLKAIKWPFDFLFNLIMNRQVDADSITTVSWVWIVIGFFLFGSFMRNTRVGLSAAVMVGVCGFLGQQYWLYTATTFGLIFVSVLLCAVVGIPLGILCGRVDAIWNTVRPVLDAMQVVHSFVYMLPFIAFWEIGNVSATMVTMVFALPPMVRLTNLGIRQVPEDVVEASRAFGASELRVLTDVQLPLARPAIMTGLNQTLLLAFSMLGVAAIMGAKGLGWVLYSAVNNLDMALGASGGLAFFLCAVALDRITQAEGDERSGLLTRIADAFAYRRDAEGTYAAKGQSAPQLEVEPAEKPEPVNQRERAGLSVMAGAAAVVVVSTFLTWGKGAGLISSWGRHADEALSGQAMSGWQDAGGSFFGILVAFLAGLAVLLALRPLFSFTDTASRTLLQLQGVGLMLMGAAILVLLVLNMFGSHSDLLETVAMGVFVLTAFLVVAEVYVRGGGRLGVDGSLIAIIGALGGVVGYLIAQPTPGVSGYSHGFGVYLALVGCIVSVAAGLVALFAAPYVSLRPLSVSVRWGTLIGSGFAVVVAVLGGAAAWVTDERLGIENRQFFRGLTSNGPLLGWPTIALAAGALVVGLGACGVLGASPERRFRSGVVTAGLGLAVMVIPLAFAFSISQSGDADYFNDRRALTGAGILFAVSAGFVFVSIGRGAIKTFSRKVIYADVAGTAKITNLPPGLDPGPDGGVSSDGRADVAELGVTQ